MAPTTANIDKYIKIVEEKSMLRTLIQTANKIIALEKGEVQEKGEHEELLKNNGLYHHLYSVQKEMAISDEE